MPWPVVYHLWRHESYQPPISSDWISDLISFRKTRTKQKDIRVEKNPKHPVIFLYIPFKGTNPLIRFKNLF